jgi:fluoroacetyl-CoA thioesterase
MKDIPVGARGEHQLLVTSEVTIDFLGSEQARVLATPWMIGYMELTARNTIKPFLDEGWDSVGTLVNVKHLAATPIGLAVRFETEVLKVEGQRVTFRVDAWDEKEKIGEGVHERFVIHIGKFATRLAAKVSQ